MSISCACNYDYAESLAVRAEKWQAVYRRTVCVECDQVLLQGERAAFLYVHRENGFIFDRLITFTTCAVCHELWRWAKCDCVVIGELRDIIHEASLDNEINLDDAGGLSDAAFAQLEAWL